MSDNDLIQEAREMWGEPCGEVSALMHKLADRLEAANIRAERLKNLLDLVIDEGVERWHTVDYTAGLHTWLGLTEDQYAAWVQGGAVALADLEEAEQ